jgi:hypothetical protein
MRDLPRIYCPGCERLADVVLELLVVGYCGLHSPSYDGVDDARVVRGDPIPSEAAINRAFCNLLHRGEPA